MNTQSITIDPAMAWLVTGLLTVLIIIVGYFGKKLLNKLEEISTFVARQDEKNLRNEDDHAVIWTKINAHTDKINEHEGRLIKLEAIKQHNHKEIL